MAAKGVRVRLTALAVLVVGVGFLVGGTAAVLLVRSQLTSVASAEALRIASSAASSGALPPFSQEVSRDGTVLRTSPELTGVRLLADWPSTGPVTGTTRLPNGDYHAVAGVLSGDHAVYASVSLEHVEEGVEATTYALLITVPFLLVAVAGTAWLLVGRALHPVEAMRARVAEITASELSRRVPEPSSGDEIGRLARTMNEMLGRLEQAHELQRRFAADAAHELRTPLAALQTRLEVGLAHPSATDWVALASELHRESSRLTSLSEELLVLARSDGAAAEPEWVDLDEIVLSEIEATRSRGADVSLSPFSAARLRGRAAELRRVVRNLLVNAERHARSRITVGLVASPDYAELVVADDGPGVPDSERELVFERFYRLQPARDRDSGGAGLGLAIVRDVVERHGGRVWLAGASSFHVRLPLTDA